MMNDGIAYALFDDDTLCRVIVLSAAVWAG